MAARCEQGAALVSVLLLVLVASILVVGMMSVSVASTRAVATNVNETQALADARSGILAAYQQLVTLWQKDGGTGSFSSIEAAQAALDKLRTDMDQWAKNPGLPGQVSVSLVWQDITPSGASGPIGKSVTITATAHRGLVTERLQSTTAVTGTIEALTYAIYSTGNLVVAGSPKIVGNVAVQDTAYVTAQPWVPNYDENYDGSPFHSKSYLVTSILWDYLLGSFQDAVGLVHVPESTSDEPYIPPTVTSGVLYTGRGVATWSQFTDIVHRKNAYAYTSQFGNTSALTGITSVPLGNLSSVIAGDVRVAPQSPAFSTDVASLVDQADSSLKQQAKSVGGAWALLGTLPHQIQGYYSRVLPDLLGEKGDYNVSGQATVSAITYINGDLKVPQTSVLYVNAPLFVNGNLTVSGTLVANAAIYVAGATYYEPVDAFQDGQILSWLNPGKGTVPRLMILSKGPLILSMHPDPLGGLLTILLNGSLEAPKKPVVMHAFLMSGDTIYIDGTEGYYDIQGGVVGKNVVLTSLAGAGQRIAFYGNDKYGYPLFKWQSENMSDTTPRLTIEYDPSYVMNPVVGTPTVSNLSVQPLSPPQRVIG